MNMNQKTILSPVSFKGVGLHTGKELQVTLLPVTENSGIRFRRTDLNPAVEIPALYSHIGDTARSTSVRDPQTGASVGTIEHLMAALAALGISNLTVECDGEEFPILDGCSKMLIGYLRQAGIKEQTTARKKLVLTEPLHYRHENGAELPPTLPTGSNWRLRLTTTPACLANKRRYSTPLMRWKGNSPDAAHSASCMRFGR